MNLQKMDIKQRLLIAGLALFAERGFNGVSIRELAAEANANSSMITYHFGGKKGLYLAVYQYIADLLNEKVTRVFIEHKTLIESIDAQQKRPRNNTILQILKVISDRYMTLMLGPNSVSIAKLLLAEQDHKSAAFMILYNGYINPVLVHIANLLGKLLDENPQSIKVKTLTINFIAQHVVWRIMHNIGECFVLEKPDDMLANYKEEIQFHIFAQLKAEIKAD
ncbi:MAG: AcrR family transcriptional regulator [Psychromonas sp.]|jgi:AcrR family transcriptional regulator|uniref:CerR family C-terminal domain-containing protein n=1 Tax=Psychromonas sp. TaxID=1884585 RepID=UPI0039E5D614